MIFGVILVAVAPLWFTMHDPTLNTLTDRHQEPGYIDKNGNSHFMGTDHLGRDVWSRLLWGARASLIVGGAGLLIGGTVGIFVGLLAGYRGGWFDRIAMRVVDAYLSFPNNLIIFVDRIALSIRSFPYISKSTSKAYHLMAQSTFH